MSVRSTSLITGEYYHVYNRGNSKQVIFQDDQDYEYFVALLNIMNCEERSRYRNAKQNFDETEKIVLLGAYCLMPNHFHILVKQYKEKGITLFMQKLSTSYVMYYNKKYKRTGALFEGKFKSKYAVEDRYLKYLFAYIHLNPLKILDKHWKTNRIQKEKQAFLLNYPYSSFNEYRTGEYTHISKNHFPDYFPTQMDFTKEVRTWLCFND